MYIRLYVRYSLFFSDYFNLNFLDRFSKNTQESNFMKILAVGLQLFHAYRQRTETHGEVYNRFFVILGKLVSPK